MFRAMLCKDYSGPQGLALGELPREPLGDDDVRVAVHVAGVGFADILVTQGQYQLKPPTPFAPGGECAGEVLDVGPAVKYVAPGDRVMCGRAVGAFAEEIVVQEKHVTRLPDGVAYTQAAALRSAYGTGYYALQHRGHLQPGEVLLVHAAAGAVGLAAVDLGRMMGARVIGTVGSDEKAAAVRAAGVEHVINYRRTPRLRDEVKALTADRGADVIYDPVGGDLFDESLRCIAWGGRLLVIGFASGRIPSAPANLALVKNMSIVGVYFGSWVDHEPLRLRAHYEQILQWCAAGRITPHISSVRPLEQAGQALLDLAARQVVGKVVLQVR
ncbi:MAG: NADPH:quinone oxidoreductase family protein [Candidatus Lambdaproteobacteria bacterium]|nr:NADPH:quinone oxidoreductase family protein [Candidatus Lambdaproteobacteria bacterium]